ncbi:hypothetical protein G6F61_014999 [Rhizopus arrhizus]|nr:hypothetical protein G6F61_014999 [Rhizopus arrhizus]
MISTPMPMANRGRNTSGGRNCWRAPVPTSSTSGALAGRLGAASGSSRNAMGSRTGSVKPAAWCNRGEVMSAGDSTGHSVTSPSGPKATEEEKRTWLTSI